MEKNFALMSSHLPVQFIETPDAYPSKSIDLECKYQFNNYKLQDGDRIAIFKLGWKSLKNYILFEWAVDYSHESINSVIFSRYDLPFQPAGDDLYQFCYISGENVVQGISPPFQIQPSSTKLSVMECLKQTEKHSQLKQLLSERDKEIIRLKEENAILKESLKAMVEQKKFSKSNNSEDDISELKEVTEKLRNAILGQQKEIDSLKIEVKKDKAYAKSLMLDKIIAEKKLEAIVSAADARNIQRLPNFDLGKIQSIPVFPLDNNK